MTDPLTALVARFPAKPTGALRSIVVTTTGPSRAFAFDLTPDAVAVTRVDPPALSDLPMAAEAFVRLAYRRLDPDHTPPVDGDADALDELRATYPGP